MSRGSTSTGGRGTEPALGMETFEKSGSSPGRTSGSGTNSDSGGSSGMGVSWRRCSPGWVSIGSRHLERALGDLGKDEVVRERRGPEQAGLPPFALDVVFRREAEAAEGGHARLRRFP